MKSKIVMGTLILTVLLSGITVFADTIEDLDNVNPIIISEKEEFDSIRVNGKEISFKGANAYYKDETLMLPLRVIAEEALDFEVIWNNEDRSIELQKDNRWTKIKIDENSYFFARMAPFKLSQGPELKNSSTFVPIEFFEEILKEEVVLEDNNLVVKDDKSSEFEIVKKEVEDIEHNTIVRYPELKGMEDTTRQYYINENIEKFVSGTKGNELFQNLDLDYELILIDEDKISLLFTGSYTVDGLEGEKTLINSFNLDLETIEEIDFRNYFKKDKDSQEKLNQILNEKAIDLGHEKFESENERIYFTGNDVVVYYYPLDDSIQTPIYLSIPLKDLEGIIEND